MICYDLHTITRLTSGCRTVVERDRGTHARCRPNRKFNQKSKLILKWKDEHLDSLWKRGQSPIEVGRSQKRHTEESSERFYRSTICSIMFPNGSFFVGLRSCRLILVHCSFSSSIAKQIHLPIQFLLAINFGGFHTQVLCNMSFSPQHRFNCIVKKFGKFQQNKISI